MSDTKNEFCFMMGYMAREADLPPTLCDAEIEMAWAAYCAIPDDATYEQVDKAADECVEDMKAVRGSVKE